MFEENPVATFGSLQKVLPQEGDDYNPRPDNAPNGWTPEEFLNIIPKEEVFASTKNPVTKAIKTAENKATMCCRDKKYLLTILTTQKKIFR